MNEPLQVYRCQRCGAVFMWPAAGDDTFPHLGAAFACRVCDEGLILPVVARPSLFPGPIQFVDAEETDPST